MAAAEIRPMALDLGDRGVVVVEGGMVVHLYSTGPAPVEEDDLRGERSRRGRGKQGDTRNNRKAQPELRVLNRHCGRESNADARS